MTVEISTLLHKEAIRPVTLSQENMGFYSRYFLVKKKASSSLRPILDLRCLNKTLQRIPMKMLTHRHLFRSIRRGDWFTSVDLKDAYFHIPIVERHRKYLRFAFQNKSYEFCVLPFGLSLAPKVFSMTLDRALAPLRSRGIRVLSYLDDLLILADKRERAEVDTRTVISHLHDLGFVLKWGKSALTPSQNTTYLGLELDSVSMRARLTQERRLKIISAARGMVQSHTATARQFMVLLGLMAASTAVVPLGLLRMRPLQKWFISQRVNPRVDLHRVMALSAQCQEALRFWVIPRNFTSGVRLGPVTHRVVIKTDAPPIWMGGQSARVRRPVASGKWTRTVTSMCWNWKQYGWP